MKLLLTLLLTSLLTTQLFAFKDTFFIGAYMGTGTGENRSDLSGGLSTLDQTSEITGFHMGGEFRFERYRNFKGRWELSYDNRVMTVEDASGTEYESKGYRAGAAYSWGYALDTMLNDEIVPFFKLGYGISKMDGGLEKGYDTLLGLGVYYITQYVEVGLGIDQEGRNYEGWRFNPEWFGHTRETNLLPYVTVNIRLY